MHLGVRESAINVHLTYSLLCIRDVYVSSLYFCTYNLFILFARVSYISLIYVCLIFHMFYVRISTLCFIDIYMVYFYASNTFST